MFVAAVAVGGEGTPGGAASTVTTKFVPTKPYSRTKNHPIAATRLIRAMQASTPPIRGPAEIPRCRSFLFVILTVEFDPPSIIGVAVGSVLELERLDGPRRCNESHFQCSSSDGTSLRPIAKSKSYPFSKTPSQGASLKEF
jgi:hypothetical protein